MFIGNISHSAINNKTIPSMLNIETSKKTIRTIEETLPTKIQLFNHTQSNLASEHSSRLFKEAFSKKD